MCPITRSLLLNDLQQSNNQFLMFHLGSQQIPTMEASGSGLLTTLIIMKTLLQAVIVLMPWALLRVRHQQARTQSYPILTDLEAAPPELLQFIKCSCKSTRNLCSSCNCSKKDCLVAFTANVTECAKMACRDFRKIPVEITLLINA